MKLLKYRNDIVNMDKVTNIYNSSGGSKSDSIYFYKNSNIDDSTVLHVSYDKVVKALQMPDSFVDLEKI